LGIDRNGGSGSLSPHGTLRCKEARTLSSTLCRIQKLLIIKLTDPEKIAHARGLLSGKGTPRTSYLRAKSVPYNSDWLFHLAPESIHFFELASATPRSVYVGDHLDEVGGAFLPRNQWCPWASQLVRECNQPWNNRAANKSCPGETTFVSRSADSRTLILRHRPVRQIPEER
jgi:hypothetical protein